MNQHQPIISVGMPVYNGERFLAQAIDTVLGQSHADFELLISDNASDDGTEAICRRYAERDPRIRYIRNSSNIGAAKNYNQLFHHSVGKYFRWLNADDLCSPLTHEKCLEVMESNPDVAMCYGKTDLIDAEGALIEHYDDRLDLRQASVADRFIRYLEVVGLTNAIYGLMRRSALERTALMGDGTFPAADINLMAELALQGKFFEIPQTLFYRRMHEKASSWDRSNQAVQQTFWRGANTRFVMPTFKKERALWRAVDGAPATFAEKARMKKYIIKRMHWSRASIAFETLQLLRPRLAGKS